MYLAKESLIKEPDSMASASKAEQDHKLYLE